MKPTGMQHAPDKSVKIKNEGEPTSPRHSTIIRVVNENPAVWSIPSSPSSDESKVFDDLKQLHLQNGYGRESHDLQNGYVPKSPHEWTAHADHGYQRTGHHAPLGTNGYAPTKDGLAAEGHNHCDSEGELDSTPRSPIRHATKEPRSSAGSQGRLLSQEKRNGTVSPTLSYVRSSVSTNERDTSRLSTPDERSESVTDSLCLSNKTNNRPAAGQCEALASRKSTASKSRTPRMAGISEDDSAMVEETRELRVDTVHLLQNPSHEVFHIHMRASNGVPPEMADESTFVGRRDGHAPEKKIVSAKGTVRGFRNRVRAGIETFKNPMSNKLKYQTLEKGKIVVYMTSMAVVRETYDRCRIVRTILQTHMVRYEERDLYMSRENQFELLDRMETIDYVELPQVFLDGFYFGGAEEIINMNESGELRTRLHRFPKIQVRVKCRGCAGYRYVPCSVCHGSKKSVHRNNFTEEFCSLRCMHCDENGLQRCELCLHEQD